MQNINCNVNECSHNNSGLCYANRVDIRGLSASTDHATSCGSFLNKCLYSDLTNNTNSNGRCDTIICNVKNCSYNENSLCNLESIDVSGANPQFYTETKCDSFNLK